MKKFLDIIKRNILNKYEIEDKISSFISNKNIEYINIKQWCKSNLLNYIIKNYDFKEVSILYFNENIQNLIKSKNIKSPYHIINLSIDKENEILQIIDYLIFNCKNTDISRLSYNDAKQKSIIWHEEINKKKIDLIENLNENSLLSTIEYENKKYSLLKIKSKNNLIVEGNKMNNCLETKWIKDELFDEESNFYSIRDEKNDRLVSFEMKTKNQNEEYNNFFIIEAKEINNQNLNLYSQDILLKLLLNYKNKDDNIFNYDNSLFYSNNYNECFSILDLLNSKNNFNIDKDLNFNLNSEVVFKYIKEQNNFDLEKKLHNFVFNKLNIDKDTIYNNNLNLKAKDTTIKNIDEKNLFLTSEKIVLKNLKNTVINICKTKNLHLKELSIINCNNVKINFSTNFLKGNVNIINSEVNLENLTPNSKISTFQLNSKVQSKYGKKTFVHNTIINLDDLNNDYYVEHLFKAVFEQSNYLLSMNIDLRKITIEHKKLYLKSENEFISQLLNSPQKFTYMNDIESIKLNNYFISNYPYLDIQDIIYNRTKYIRNIYNLLDKDYSSDYKKQNHYSNLLVSFLNEYQSKTKFVTYDLKIIVDYFFDFCKDKPFFYDFFTKENPCRLRDVKFRNILTILDLNHDLYKNCLNKNFYVNNHLQNKKIHKNIS